MKQVLLVLGAVILVALLVAGAGIGTYNKLVSLDQDVQRQWAQVENVYQRRLDLVPNLVETVKGAAAFERDTFTAVAEARSRAAEQTSATPAAAPPTDPAALARFQAAQDRLGAELGRLMVVVERYPNLTATQNFRDLQAQLEGTENRIAVERMRYNEVAQQFNATRLRFPTNIIGDLFGERFHTKAYFSAARGAEQAPAVHF